MRNSSVDEAVFLNLGSGPVGAAGWVNIDRSPNVVLDRLPIAKRALRAVNFIGDAHMQPWSRDIVRGDIKNLDYETGSVAAVYSSHTLEHLYFAEAKQVIREAHRVLVPDGILRLALPDAHRMAEVFLADRSEAEASLEYNRMLNAHPMERPSPLKRLLGMVGGHIHLWQPTAPLVEHMLLEAGFRSVEHCDFNVGNCPRLQDVETRANSFFVEAVK